MTVATLVCLSTWFPRDDVTHTVVTLTRDGVGVEDVGRETETQREREKWREKEKAGGKTETRMEDDLLN